MIVRDAAEQLRRLARGFPVVVMTGPRQAGKSTLCRMVFPGKSYASLESPDVRGFATADPRGFLAGFAEGAILDEIQRVPELASYLQEEVDGRASREMGRWVLTGSQNEAVMSATTQSLAGRAGVMHLLPLSRGEVERFANAPSDLMGSLLSGGYPRVFDRGIRPADYFSAYVATYLERDVRQMLNVGDLATFQRFVQLAAGRTGQLQNYLSMASDTGVTQPTVRSWMSVLEASFVVLRLPPFFGNLTKRLTRSAKLHFVDSGLACWLLGVRTAEQLETHPLRGAVFESYVVSEVMKHRSQRGESGGMFHYRDQSGLEADLVVEGAEGLLVLDMKSGRTVVPEMAASVRRVAEVLGQTGRRVRTAIVYGGDRSDPMAGADVGGTRFVPWSEVGRVLEGW